FAKLLVVGRRLFVCVRHHGLPGEAASTVASGAGPAGIVPSMANVVWGRDQANAWAIKLALEPSPTRRHKGGPNEASPDGGGHPGAGCDLGRRVCFGRRGRGSRPGGQGGAVCPDVHANT